MLILPHSEFSPPGPIVISRREKALNLNLDFFVCQMVELEKLEK